MMEEVGENARGAAVLGAGISDVGLLRVDAELGDPRAGCPHLMGARWRRHAVGMLAAVVGDGLAMPARVRRAGAAVGGALAYPCCRSVGAEPVAEPAHGLDHRRARAEFFAQ